MTVFTCLCAKFYQVTCSFTQEKTRQYEEEKDKVRSSRQEFKKRNDEEVEVIRQDLVQMSNKVARLQDELREKDELNLQLRLVVYNPSLLNFHP